MEGRGIVSFFLKKNFFFNLFVTLLGLYASLIAQL